MPKAFLIRKNTSSTSNYDRLKNVYRSCISLPYYNPVEVRRIEDERMYKYHESYHHTDWKYCTTKSDLHSDRKGSLSDESNISLDCSRSDIDESFLSPAKSNTSCNSNYFSYQPNHVLPLLSRQHKQDGGGGPPSCLCCHDSNNNNLPSTEHTEDSEELASTSQKPFSCHICGKSFRLSSTLCRHKIIHTTHRPHKCHLCFKSFNRSSTLKTHLRTHNRQKEFVCQVCGKGFHQKGNLRNHVLIHTGEKPYKCKTCEKSFNKLSNLKFHMHSHTDQKPYRCRFCKLSMARRGELKQHIATFHADEV